MSDVFWELTHEEIDKHCSYHYHRGLRGAFRKGWIEGVNGKDEDENRYCPYVDDGKTYSTAYARSWRQGYRYARELQRKQHRKMLAGKVSRALRRMEGV